MATEATTTSLALKAGRVELLDLPGDPKAPPLVLLHEGLGSVGLWRSFPHDLANVTGDRTVAFSRYGHGNSDPPPKPRTPDFMHEEALETLPAVLEALPIEDPILVGHSDGASIALINAAHHPVRALVAMAPHVFVEDVTVEAIRHTLEDYEHGDLRDKLRRHHQAPDAAFHGWCDVWLDPAFKSWDLRPLLHEITCPLLLIQGNEDQYATMAHLDAIERMAGGPVERVHLDTQHSPHLEAPEETLETIARFVDRVTATSKAL